ncbi:protein-tyrosine phosphatase-like protein [Melampsora americana]|nr:protein-tyrosine phosphatase-like protein [Melampsora americana]
MDEIKISKVESVKLRKLSHQFHQTIHQELTKEKEEEEEREEEKVHHSIGSLHLTTHHLIWKPFNPSAKSDSSKQSQSSFGQVKDKDEEVWFTHPLIAAVQYLPSHSEPTLLIRLVNFLTYTFTFQSQSQLEQVWDSIKALVHSRKQGDKSSTYAFLYGSQSNNSKIIHPAWDLYDPVREFTRMNSLGDQKAWRITSINNDFNFCSTYPQSLLVPAKISDTTLSYAVKYRSKGRLPVGSYVHWANGSSITRSSQPMVGFKNARSIQDEKLIEAIFHSHSLHTGPSITSLPTISSQSNQHVIYGATSTNLIIDARPTTNAMANTVKGAGTENMENYKACRKAYLGIDNIHVMRDSLHKLVSALHESFISAQPVSLESLRKSGWLKHISAILDGVSLITRTVHVSNSHVLIHCSDGWDRTSQLSALSQVCLDPYYRTFDGFAILVEKDWLSFGHKFSDRSGVVVSGKEMVNFGDHPSSYSNSGSNIQNNNHNHIEDNIDGTSSVGSSTAWVTSFQKQLNFATSSTGHSHAYKETSPVFHQFLDCVYQLMRQFPLRFEFNSAYLETLYKELYSAQYGTFLFDNEEERIRNKAQCTTRSVWESFEGSQRQRYRNELYDPSLDDPTKRENEDQGVLLPNPKEVKYWWELFGCADSEMNPVPKPRSTTTSELNPPRSTTSSSINKLTDESRRIDVGQRQEPSDSNQYRRGNSGIETNSGSNQATGEWSGETLPSYLTAPLKTQTISPSQSFTNMSTTSRRGMNENLDNSVNLNTIGGEQLQMAFQTAKTMGWSTWDRLKRGYEEATGSGIGGLPWREADEANLRIENPKADVKSREAELGSGVWDDKQKDQDERRMRELVEDNPWRTVDNEDRYKKNHDSQFSTLSESKPEPKAESEGLKMNHSKDEDVNNVMDKDSDPLGVGLISSG